MVRINAGGFSRKRRYKVPELRERRLSAKAGLASILLRCGKTGA
jgi:hypothetical protein